MRFRFGAQVTVARAHAATAASGSFAAVPGISFRGPSARPPTAGSPSTTGTTTSGFVSLARSRNERCSFLIKRRWTTSRVATLGRSPRQMLRWSPLRPADRVSRICFSIALLILVSGVACAQVAPSGLLNKTITFSFTNNVTLREPEGRTVNRQASISYTDYVSSAGRIFQRSSRSVGRRSRSADKEPDKARQAGGEVHTNRFEGNKLVIMNSYAEGAVRMVVSFDPAFSTCTVDVMLGKEGGGTIKRRGLDGVIREILTYDVTNKTCTIRDGNPFAD